MKILALELSSAVGSIAWREDGTESFSCEFPNDRKHSGVFFENLQLCNQRFRKPDQIVVGLGPGSYAGTRIAIAAAVGLEMATGARLLGVASLCGMATDAEEYAVVGDARRQTFFFAVVHQRSCVEGPLLCTSTELAERIERVKSPIFATQKIPAAPRAQIAFPAATVLARIEAAKLSSGPLEPIYLREPHITFPKTPHARSATTK